MASFYETSVPQTVGETSSAAPRQSIFLTLLLALLVPAILAYALVSGNETQVVALVLASLGGLVIIARPFWGLMLFIGLLYTRPEESIPALAGAHLLLIISLVTLVALVFQKLLRREPIVKTPLNGMIIGFGVAVVLSSFVSGTTSAAVQDIGRLVILVLLILNLAASPERYRALVTAVLLFTGYLAAYSIYLYFTGGALVQNGTLLRSQATGIFSDPNDLAATIVAGLGLTLVRMRQASGLFARLLYLAAAGVMIAAILLTESRGGMIALLAVLGIFVFQSSRNKPLAVCLAVVMALGLLAFKSGHMTNFDSGEDSANSRFWFWSNGLEQLIHRPLLGVGYGGFPDVNDGMTAHNSFVLCFTETGLLGYFSWIGCLYYAFSKGGSAEDTETAGSRVNTRWDALGAQLALVGYLAASFWLSHTYSPILYVLLSLPVAQRLTSIPKDHLATLRKAEHRRDWLRIFLLSVGSVLFIYTLSMRMR